MINVLPLAQQPPNHQLLWYDMDGCSTIHWLSIYDHSTWRRSLKLCDQLGDKRHLSGQDMSVYGTWCYSRAGSTSHASLPPRLGSKSEKKKNISSRFQRTPSRPSIRTLARWTTLYVGFPDYHLPYTYMQSQNLTTLQTTIRSITSTMFNKFVSLDLTKPWGLKYICRLPSLHDDGCQSSST